MRSSSKHQLASTALLLTSLAFLGGCVTLPPATHVRVATATSAELKSLDDKDGVWYDFEPGDIVPVHFAFLGVFEGASETPTVFRAKRKFSLVMYKNTPMRISFDGKTFAGPESSKSVVAVLPREKGDGGEVGWIIYIGEDGNVQGELEKAAKKSKLDLDSLARFEPLQNGGGPNGIEFRSTGFGFALGAPGARVDADAEAAVAASPAIG